MKPQLLVVLFAAAIGGAACSKHSPTAPTPPPATTTPPPPAAASVTRIDIAGTTAFTFAGQQAQLTATATLSDGTTKDVTALATWTSGDALTIAVTPSGQITVVRLGAAYVFALYQSKGASIRIQATPPGTYVAFGRVREPGSGGLPGVAVREATSGSSTVSNKDGNFSLAALTAPRITFEKDGYERVDFDAKPGVYSDVPMQHVTPIVPGDTVTGELAPNDMAYAVNGSRCDPCRLIRVAVSTAGVLQMRLTWEQTHAKLNLWVNGQLFEGTALGPSSISADVPVTAGEVLLHVGMLGTNPYVYVPFSLKTTIASSLK